MQEREQGKGVLIYRHLFRAYKGCSRIHLVDQSECENNISLELVYLKNVFLQSFMNLNFELFYEFERVRSLGSSGMDAENGCSDGCVEGELIHRTR